jgi:hypothetical protein
MANITTTTTPDDWEVRRGVVPPCAYLKAWERGEHIRPNLSPQ